MTPLAEMVPAMSDADLKALRANAERLSTSGSPTQLSAAAEIMPIIDAETARRAVEAGAQYVVSPVFKREIIDEAHRLGVPAMPGCFTPTEILAATEAGADTVKVFPADVLGMPFFKGVLAPMPHLKLMPTGGVSLTNAGDWVRAGAVAVGVGSALLDKQAISEGDFAVLTENARTLRASVEAGRADL